MDAVMERKKIPSLKFDYQTREIALSDKGPEMGI